MSQPGKRLRVDGDVEGGLQLLPEDLERLLADPMAALTESLEAAMDALKGDVDTSIAAATGSLQEAVDTMQALTTIVEEFKEQVQSERNAADEELDGVKQALREQLELLDQ